MRGQPTRRLVHGALAPILLALASLACLSLRAQDLPSALTPAAAWMPGEKARYQYQQSVRETEGTKDEVKFVSNGGVDIEVLTNDNGVLRFRWLRRVDNAEWEVARMPFPIRGHAGERLIRASIEEGLPVLVQFDTRTRRGSVENVDELATRVKRLFDKVGGDDTRRPRTPDEQLAANQQPSAGIYRMRGIHEKQVISPKGVAAWYARMALAE
ncbi:MAG TPA: hypothetical protein VFV17_09620, partial [Usitatibacteraceae bacterium]|nr:hypothetical protein [Usitatibacteraceae bacterium]